MKKSAIDKMMGNGKVEIYRDWVTSGKLPKFKILKNEGGRYIIKLRCLEVTTQCQLTKLPDFGVLTINYIPNQRVVETKSLKEFIHALRDKGIFQEECTLLFANEIWRQLKPHWVSVTGVFNNRGGIEEEVTVAYGNLGLNPLAPPTPQ